METKIGGKGGIKYVAKDLADIAKMVRTFEASARMRAEVELRKREQVRLTGEANAYAHVAGILDCTTLASDKEVGRG